MSDIRFKISGDSPTFFADVRRVGSSVSEDANAFVSVSGSCVILTGLVSNVQYQLNVYDCIGNTITHNFTTPINVGTTTLSTKNILMPSVLYSPVPGVCVLQSPKLITITPPLSNGESITFKLDLINTFTENANGSINVSKRCGVGGTYQSIGTRSTQGTSTLNPVTIQYGDDISLDMAIQRVNQSISASGNVKVNLFDVTSSTVNPIIADGIVEVPLNYVVPTTTTTTTLTPISNVSISVGSVSNLSTTNSYCKCYCGKLTPSTPLASNQSFRLNFTNSINLSSGGILNPAGCSCVYIINESNGQKYNIVQDSISNRNPITLSNVSYITVNSSNINDYVLYATARSDAENNDTTHTINSSIILNSITNSSNANFILGNAKTVSATFRKIVKTAIDDGDEIPR
jgi:hypothetical protein